MAVEGCKQCEKSCNLIIIAQTLKCGIYPRCSNRWKEVRQIYTKNLSSPDMPANVGEYRFSRNETVAIWTDLDLGQNIAENPLLYAKKRRKWNIYFTFATTSFRNNEASPETVRLVHYLIYEFDSAAGKRRQVMLIENHR